MPTIFANLGAAYGTAKSGVGISSIGVIRPDIMMRSIIPVVIAGVLGIYGLITAVIINGKLDNHLAAGLTAGPSVRPAVHRRLDKLTGITLSITTIMRLSVWPGEAADAAAEFRRRGELQHVGKSEVLG